MFKKHSKYPSAYLYKSFILYIIYIYNCSCKLEDELEKVNNLTNNYKRALKVTRTFKIMEIFQPEGIYDETVDMNLTKAKADVPSSSHESNNDTTSIMSRMVNKSQVTNDSRTKSRKIVENDGALSYNQSLKRKELKEQLGFDIEEFYKEKKLKYKNFNSEKKRKLYQTRLIYY